MPERDSLSDLTKRQRDAVALLQRSPHPGVLTSSKTVMVAGRPWIHRMTAYALLEKGVVHIERYGEKDAEIHLRNERGEWG